MFVTLVAVVAVPTVKLLAVPVNPAPEPLKPVADKIPVLGTNDKFDLTFAVVNAPVGIEPVEVSNNG